jgi:GTP-binding protein HflX
LIRNLPHRLVEAFKATLEEAVLADFLVHVLDASHPQVYDFCATTMKVLEELGADSKKMIAVLKRGRLRPRTGRSDLRKWVAFP